jgi:glycosyltransferase involved in cell wall biosynthesis
MNISIIIPTLNKLPRLKLTIESIRNQDYPKEKYEVIIVDNGSTDGTADYISEISDQLPIIYCKQKQRGRAVSRNFGVEYAHNDLLVFTDDDCIVSPEFLYQHALFQNDYDIVHGKIINMASLKFFQDPTEGVLFDDFKKCGNLIKHQKSFCISKEDVALRFDEKIRVQKRMSTMERLIIHVLSRGNSKDHWIGFTGGNISVKKDQFVLVDGFDEKFGTMWGCEDLELGYRFSKLGKRFYYANDATA